LPPTVRYEIIAGT